MEEGPTRKQRQKRAKEKDNENGGGDRGPTKERE